MVSVEADQRRTGQRGRLDRDPQQPQVAADADQAHRRHEQQQAADEDRLRLVAEEESLLGVAGGVAGLAAEDLRRAGGMSLDGFDVVVTGLEPARGGR